MVAPWPQHMTDAERAKIVRLYRDHGVLITDIALRMRRGSETVRAVLKDAGVHAEHHRAGRLYQEAP